MSMGEFWLVLDTYVQIDSVTNIFIIVIFSRLDSANHDPTVGLSIFNWFTRQLDPRLIEFEKSHT